MYSRLFTYIHHRLKILILVKGKSYSYLIKLIFGKYAAKPRELSKDLYALVLSALLHIVVKYTVNMVAPLGILSYPVDKALRRLGKSHKEDVFLVEALGSYVP